MVHRARLVDERPRFVNPSIERIDVRTAAQPHVDIRRPRGRRKGRTLRRLEHPVDILQDLIVRDANHMQSAADVHPVRALLVILLPLVMRIAIDFHDKIPSFAIEVRDVRPNLMLTAKANAELITS